MTNLFEPFLRRTSMAAKKNTTALVGATYGYDGGRLSTVTDGSWNSTYPRCIRKGVRDISDPFPAHACSVLKWPAVVFLARTGGQTLGQPQF
jgi:hypothetical protein